MEYYLNPFIFITQIDGKYITNSNGNELVLLKNEMEILEKTSFSKERFIEETSENRFNLLEKNHIVCTVNLKSRMDSQYIINEGWFELSGLDNSSYDKLRESTILILGCGGLGTHVSWSMIALGIKKIILVDDDIIEKSNLNRQILYTISDVGKMKTEVLKKKLEEINNDVEVYTYNIKIENPNTDLECIFKEHDIDLAVKALDTPLNHMQLYGEFFKKRKLPYVSGSTIGTNYTIGPSYHPDLENNFRDSPYYNQAYPDQKNVVNGKGTSLSFIMSKIASNVAQEAFYILIDRIDLVKYNADIEIKSILDSYIESKKNDINNSLLLFSLLPSIIIATMYQNNILVFGFQIAALLIFTGSRLDYKDYFLFLTISTFVVSLINSVRQLSELPGANFFEKVINIPSLLMNMMISICFYTVFFLVTSFFFKDIKERVECRYGKFD